MQGNTFLDVGYRKRHSNYMSEDYNSIYAIYEILNEPFVVFGYGSVGKRFIQLIRINGYLHNLVGVGVSHEYKNNSQTAIPIRNIDSFDKNLPVLIAVHDSILPEVEYTIQHIGFRKYIDIYPLFTDLFFGEPLERNVELCIDSLLSVSDNLGYVILSLVIEQELGNCSVGNLLYEKYITAFSSREAYAIRLNRFKENIRRSEEVGFTQDLPISVNHNKTIILDGLHRSVLSYYFGNHIVKADLYNVDSNIYDIYSNKQILSYGRLHEIYTADEIGIIDEQYNLLMRSMKNHQGLF